MIGIIGYGMVGKAVKNAFPDDFVTYSDPKYNTVTVEHICEQNPEAIFVCVPTPTDDSNYAILKSVLQKIKDSGYNGLTVVKSTVLPQHLEGFDIVYNPEFLSRETANNDFLYPPMVIVGGEQSKCEQLLELYRTKSKCEWTSTFVVDIPTACLAKYAMNTFYALKVTYMNELYDVAEKMGVHWTNLAVILGTHPWMGTNHFRVPGPDGKRGFGGPCLPKDTEALTREFDLKLLNTVLELNKGFRSK